MTDHKDKIFLDISDNDALQELFSRMEAGDAVTFTKVKCTLDESANKLVTLSITDIQAPKTPDAPEDEEAGEDPKEEATETPGQEAAEEDQEPVMQMMKKQKP